MVRVELRTQDGNIPGRFVVDMPAVPQIGTHLVKNSIIYRVCDVIWSYLYDDWDIAVVLTDGVRILPEGD